MSGLTEFFRLRRQALVGYVRRRLDEAAGEDAEDIVQDVMVALFNRADPTAPIQDLAAFVYQALRNRIVDRYRRRRETLPLEERVPDPGPDPLFALERRETLDAVFAAMDGLSPDEKAVVMATELEGRTFQELAARWRVPVGTLLARKSRALRKIRTRLTGQSEISNQGDTHELTR